MSAAGSVGPVRLLLVRHGETVLNERGVLDAEAPGARLSALGRAQAAALVDRLAGERIAVLGHSSMTRTRETAQPLASARALPLRLIAGSEEILAGDLQGVTDPRLVHRYLETALAWSSGDLAPRIPGGEDGGEFFDRFDAGIAEIVRRLRSAHRDGVTGSAVLVTHSAAIRVWVARRAQGLGADFSARRPLSNTGIVVLEGAPESGWRLAGWAVDRIPGAVDGGHDDAGDPLGAPLDASADDLD
ncbi:histidine phosphatase family protein [Schumannella luteola]|uniref:Putative phosphoglycerate mutase n=1 Tax=Schumannella luteola TaxID=472059 RepID=A0A852YEL9_9MICO|nr:histidine phosphatase family protein [Schumannella luteola]NYG99750.1 putative phosphoglycerate mutase [Schumannella luteola]TPX06528.1 histidine phosphatase family protein [Schumannella luteola]